MTLPSRKTLFEIIRLLIFQIREEQHSRQALIRALTAEETKPVQTPTDEEVSARIQELKNILTTKKESSRM